MMTRHHKDPGRYFFDTEARDLTPESVRDAARVLYLPFSGDPELARDCASVLSDMEQQRAQRFVAEQDRARFQQRRAFRRFCGAAALDSPESLSQIHFEETDTGRPFLPGLPDTWFSFSSSRTGCIGTWSSTHAVGIDIEDRTRKLEPAQIARRFFTDAEARLVETAAGPLRRRHFLELWCLKEAALKSIGQGLAFGLDRFEFALTPKRRVVAAPAIYGGPGRFQIRMLDGAEAYAALVMRSRA